MNRFQKPLIAILLVIMILPQYQIGTPKNAYASDEYDSLRDKWRNLLVGTNLNTADPDIANQITRNTSTASAYWATLKTDSSRTYLWSDLASWNESSTITSTYTRLKTLAIAYATEGSSLYGNSTLAGDIISGLDWLYANKYNENKSQSDNWWDWQIGAPQALNDTALLVYDQLSAAQIVNYGKAVDKFVPNPTLRLGTSVVETGANRSDKAQVVIVRGILGEKSTKLEQGRDALSQIFLYVTSGDGFYSDGSFIQHSNIAYTASYGRVLLAGLSKLLYVLGGSTWAVTDSNAARVYDWITDAVQPILYKGAAFDMVRGRAIAREAQQDHEMGRNLIASINLIALSAPAPEKAVLQGMVKRWVSDDKSFASYYSGLPISDIIWLKETVGDASVATAAPLTVNKVFNKMARLVHQRPEAAFGVSMFSSRVARYESLNGENVHGWHTGDGVTYLYNADLNQYSGGYWATINPYRLPGITVDPIALTNAQGSGTTSTYNFVGGVSDGRNGLAGMRFSALGSDLTGRKSWFFFGDKMVALGSSITSTSGRPIETIIENRKLNTTGSNGLTVNNAAKPTTSDWSETINGANWAHLAGSVPGADIGYYFPGSPTIEALREARTGAWSDVQTSGSSLPIHNHFLSLSFMHGVNPTNATYSYVVLPGRTVSEVAAYAANPKVSILENSVDAQAVYDSILKLVGVNFWNNISKTISLNGSPYITSDKQASVLITETSSDITVSVSDPTQTNTGFISLTLNQTVSRVVSASTGITVTQTNPSTTFRVNVDKAGGATFHVTFKK
ncbi:polysaccharide lyase 8 family protein [Paenibacillus illinoisensis]|uniref:polysaccharide lyase 8 family protein n=1 Tax=Paenibacillus illinoisensis TaxID=59845 RepID=UPI003D293F3B